jgi:putative transposase
MTHACQAMGLHRATAYRHLRPPVMTCAPPRNPSHRRIPDAERASVLAMLDSERFIDQPPREVYGKLLTEGTYLCSWRSFYRLLNERAPIKERRNHREPRSHAVPRLVACAPNEVWSWDISKLPTYERGVFLNLYVVLDMFSRYVVAWMVAAHENSALAKQLFAEAVARYGIDPGTLVVHQDRGAPMTSHGFAQLLGELGVERSFSRPRVSDDNAFSESLFHTVKYQPDYPGRFCDIAHARAWCDDFFRWYNAEHHHDGLALFTPQDVFLGHVERIAERRQHALDEAFRHTPQRFVAGQPVVPRPPARVMLNPLDAAPPTVRAVIEAADDDVDKLWPKRAACDIPIINLPGAHMPQAAAANAT